ADALLLRPLPVARPDELFTVGSAETVEAFGGANSLNASYRDYIDIRRRAKSFSGLAAFAWNAGGVTMKPDAPPKLRMGALVSDNFFSVMGVQPEIGRDFSREEHQVPGRDAVVILGHDLWVKDFGSDPAVLGRRIRINGV